MNAFVIPEGVMSVNALSRQELRVALALARGDSYNEVAKALRLNVNSVRTYWGRVADKLGFPNRSRTHLAHFMLRFGLVPNLYDAFTFFNTEQSHG